MIPGLHDFQRERSLTNADLIDALSRRYLATWGVSTRLMASPDTIEEVDAATKVRDAFEKMWGVIVWNDPVNLMSYVVFVFKRVLKMNPELAHKHMMEVHEKGKSLVLQETREKAEFTVHQLQGFGLQATMEKI